MENQSVVDQLGVSHCLNCKSSLIGDKTTDWQGNDYIECKKCLCWVQSPIKEIKYEANYWGKVVDPDGVERDLTKEQDFKVKNWYCETVRYTNQLKPGKILDVGAGLGFFLSAVDSSWEKHALEVSQEATSFINQNFEDIRTYNCILEDLDPGVREFDVIMCYHVIEHVMDPDALIKQLSERLKPGGKLIIGTPNIGSFAAKRFKGNFRLLGIGHIVLYHKKELQNLLVRNGFKVKKVAFPFFSTNYFNFKNLKKLYDKRELSPPFYGSVMNFYAVKDS